MQRSVSMGRVRFVLLALGLIAGALMLPRYWAVVSTAPTLVVNAVQAGPGNPPVTEAQARSRALEAIAERRPDLVGMAVVRAALTPAAKQISTASGFRFDQSSPEDVWVVELEGPGQNGWNYVTALEVVDAHTGEVVASSVLSYN